MRKLFSKKIFMKAPSKTFDLHRSAVVYAKALNCASELLLIDLHKLSEHL
jgi:hypothetical protein